MEKALVDKLRILADAAKYDASCASSGAPKRKAEKGGLGSTTGCFVGALLVGLMANYTGFLAPKVAMFSNIGLMVAVLLWRPRGLYPVTSR